MLIKIVNVKALVFNTLGVLQIVIIYFLVGFISSLFGAIAGLGGGVIIKPVLDFMGDYDVATIGILSAATVFTMACVTLLKSMSSGVKVSGKVSFILAIGSIVGGIIGKLLFNYLLKAVRDGSLITGVQAIILSILLIIIYILVTQKHKMKTYHLRRFDVIFTVGLILGVVAAFLGIGGGPLNVAILAIGFSMNAKESAINSIFIIFFSQLSSLLMTTLTTGFSGFDLSMLPMLMIGAVVGGLLGGILLHKFASRQVEKVFATGLIVILLINVYNSVVAFL